MFRSIRQIASFFGIILGSLSLFTLARLAVDIGLSAPVAELVKYYNTLVENVFAWTEPVAQQFLLWLTNHFSIQATLAPEWKHILVLMWLYFSADARANLALKRYGFAVFTIVWGVIIGFAGSLATGLTALTSWHFDTLSLVIPTASIAIFEFGRAIWSAVFRLPSPARAGDDMTRREIFFYLLLRFPVTTSTLGLLTTLFFSFFVAPKNLGDGFNENLAALFVFIIVLTVLFLSRGVMHGLTRRTEAETLFERMSNSGSLRVGLLMVATFAGALFVLATNAGLAQLGL